MGSDASPPRSLDLRRPHPLAPHRALLIEKGRRRRIHASADGIRYLSIHTARGGLQITRSART